MFKSGKIPRKIRNQNLLVMCTSTHLQTFTKVCEVVEEEMRLLPIHYFIKYMAKILSSKGVKFQEKYKWNWNFLVICTFICIVSKTIPRSGIRVVALTRKLTDGLKTLFPYQLHCVGVQ